MVSLVANDDSLPFFRQRFFATFAGNAKGEGEWPSRHISRSRASTTAQQRLNFNGYPYDFGVKLSSTGIQDGSQLTGSTDISETMTYTRVKFS